MKDWSARRCGRNLCLIGVLLCALAGCAARPSGAPAAAAVGDRDDPLEPINRKVFVVNEFLDRFLFRPITEVYVKVVPQPARGSIHDALANAKQPITMLNEVLQRDPQRLGISLERFAVNTTIGMAGLVDVASRWGIPRATADFGETLYSWGISSGPYLVLPVLGPSNPRDAVGMAVDSYVDPLTFLANAKGLQEVEVPRLVTDGVDQRADVLTVLDDLRKNSIDFYAELRSLSQQQRAAQLNRGEPSTPKNFYDVSDSSAPLPPHPVRKAAAR
ncbi:MAG TPA: VacJ family lipoprotein [Stellaceae bacterium]|nr:VacJ family lipoprotein [Stellaceae bacterium]